MTNTHARPSSRLCLTLVAGAAALWATTSRARADHDFVVLPVTVADRELAAITELSEAVQTELETRNLTHLQLASARGLFEARHSREPSPTSQEDLDLLVEAANKALTAVTNADWQTAVREVQLARKTSAAALETINRRYQTARHIFRICLLAVQSYAEAGNEPEARRMAVECLANSPGLDLPPESHDFPPYVRTFLRQAEETLAQSSTAPLQITSKPSGCTTYINGRQRGITPYRQDNPARRPYLVQVECDQAHPGRVHTITPGDEPAPIHVDTAFEAAVATDGGLLRLRYDELVRPVVRDHVQQVLDVIRSRDALVVSKESPHRFTLSRVRRSGGSRTIHLPSGYTQDELRAAMQEMLASEPKHPPLAQSLTPPPPSAFHKESSPAHPRVARALGGTLSAAGFGLAAASWGLHIKRRTIGLDLRSIVRGNRNYGTYAGDWLNARPAPYWLAAAGATTATAGATTLALAIRHTPYPWWVYSIPSAAGAGLALWGGISMSRHEPCTGNEVDLRRCALASEQYDRGALVLVNALPFVAAPLLHLLLTRKGAERRPVLLTPTATPTSLGVTLDAAL